MKALLALLLLAQDDTIGRLRHMDPEVRRAACTIVKQCNLRSAVPYLVEDLGSEGDGAVKLAMMDALETLTGIKGKFGDDAAKWSQWWETEGHRTFPATRLEEVAGCLPHSGPALTDEDIAAALAAGARAQWP